MGVNGVDNRLPCFLIGVDESRWSLLETGMICSLHVFDPSIETGVGKHTDVIHVPYTWLSLDWGMFQPDCNISLHTTCGSYQIRDRGNVSESQAENKSSTCITSPRVAMYGSCSGETARLGKSQLHASLLSY